MYNIIVVALVIHRRNMSKKIKIDKVKQCERILDVLTKTTNKQRTAKYTFG